MFKPVVMTLLIGLSVAALAESIDQLMITPSDLAESEPMAQKPLAAPVSNAPFAKLNYLEIHQRARQTTVILRLQNASSPTAFMLHNPDRLIIDLPQAAVSKAMPKNIQDNGLIQQIRFGRGPDGGNNTRLVFDLATRCTYALLIDEDAQTHQQSITLILNTIAPVPAPVLTTPPREPLDLQQLHGTSAPTTMLPVKITPVRTPKAVVIHSSPARDVIIVIDPGHGGKDSGAIGIDRRQEKTVVLAISKRLAELLNQQPGMRAKLTRQGDYFIGLRERLRLARAYKADVFMAIHADAFKNDEASGASVFALSQHGASSEAARWLAERENISEFAGLPFKTTDYQLKSVLLDMSQTATNQDSLSLGAALLRNLTPITPLHARAVEQAGFMVLKSPDIPSVLVETGFISNPTESALLVDPAFQQKLANALMQGIIHYCQQNPPPDTYFEMQFKKPN